MISDEGLRMKNIKPIDIRERTFKFSIRILKMTKYLPKNSINNVLMTQIIRSSTSIGANIEEAQGAHTKTDFVYCMNVAKKEARETFYWLKLIKEMNSRIEDRFSSLLTEGEEIIKILTSIVKKSNPRNFN